MSVLERTRDPRGPSPTPLAEHADIALLEQALGDGRRAYLAVQAPARALREPNAHRGWRWRWPVAAALTAGLLAGVFVLRPVPDPIPVPGQALAGLPAVSLSELNTTLTQTGIALRTPPPPPVPASSLPAPRIELPGLRAPPALPPVAPG